MLGEHVSMSEALLVTVVCMLIVFATLYALALILDSFKRIFKEEVPKVENGKVVKQASDDAPNIIDVDNLDKDEDIVAALAAAIVASGENKNSRIHIKSVKLIG